jgi:hypothetical protein
VVVHTYPNQYDKVYKPLLGNKDFDGPSLQLGDMKKTHAETLNWVKQSAASTKSWFVSLDEIGPANTGVKADVNDPAHDDVRAHALWGNLMAGGAGVEWYFGYQQPHTDLNCEDWRSRDKMGSDPLRAGVLPTAAALRGDDAGRRPGLARGGVVFGQEGRGLCGLSALGGQHQADAGGGDVHGEVVRLTQGRGAAVRIGNLAYRSRG